MLLLEHAAAGSTSCLSVYTWGPHKVVARADRARASFERGEHGLCHVADEHRREARLRAGERDTCNGNLSRQAKRSRNGRRV